MRIIKGDGGGVTFRSNIRGSTYFGYLFAVRRDGSYRLWVCQSNSCNSPLLQGYSGAIHRGLNQTNLITVIVKGNAITLYMNQQEIGTVTDNTFSQGSIGVVAFDVSNPTEVAFSNRGVVALASKPALARSGLQDKKNPRGYLVGFW